MFAKPSSIADFGPTTPPPASRTAGARRAQARRRSLSTKMALETLPFDGADAVDTPEEQAALLAEAFASADPAILTSALNISVRARGIAGWDTARAVQP